MSDVNGAAPAAAEQPSLPMDTPVQPPAPIESAGPTPDPKPAAKAEPKADVKAEAKPSSSISEALKKAEAKVKADAEKPAKDAPKVDAKAAPKNEAKAEVKSDGPVRGEDGKFVPKDGPKEAPKVEADAQPWREAPKRFSDDGKREWEKAPDSVKAEAHRAINEIEKGIKEYKERFEPLKQYDELARQNNTTLKDAVDRYTTLEKQLASDTPQEKWAALQKVFDYAGVNVREFAAQIAGVSPDQVSVHAEQQMQQLRTKNAELEHELSGYRSEKEQKLMSTVDEFAAQNPRFDELSGTISKLLQQGLAENLQEAYQMADRLKPAANGSALTPATPETPAAHTPAKSVTGSPLPGSSPTTRKASNSIKEALQRAMAQAS
jgi:predicted  nucleic acid-binding Zn-ribbon protein